MIVSSTSDAPRCQQCGGIVEPVGSAFTGFGGGGFSCRDCGGASASEPPREARVRLMLTDEWGNDITSVEGWATDEAALQSEIRRRQAAYDSGAYIPE